MEITRQLKPSLNLSSEAPAQVKSPRVSTAALSSTAPVAAVSSESLQLEQLHHALDQQPEVDLDKVAALKLALARGELNTEPAALASSMLDYHRASSQGAGSA
jgi:negative regulator of flagellin synthesis FlgM